MVKLGKTSHQIAVSNIKKQSAKSQKTKLIVSILIAVAASLIAFAIYSDESYSVNTPDRSLEQDLNWGVLAINTSKNVYKKGETAVFSIGILDEKGLMVCDSDLKMVITAPGGSQTNFSTADGSISMNEECLIHDYTHVADFDAQMQVVEEGWYEVKVMGTNPLGDYQITDAFLVDNNYPVEIHRRSSTRIYPQSEYPVEVSLVAERSGRATVIEQVPASFNISQLSDFPEPVVTQSGDTKLLQWELDFVAGQEVAVGYVYKAPITSPEFYSFEPMEVKFHRGDSSLRNFLRLPGPVFSEARQWMIAGDAVSHEETVVGSVVGGAEVSTSGPLTAAAGHLYLASVSQAGGSAGGSGVSGVSGLGLNWTKVSEQCSTDGDSPNTLSMYMAYGSPIQDGVVTASFSSTELGVDSGAGLDEELGVDLGTDLGTDPEASGSADPSNDPTTDGSGSESSSESAEAGETPAATIIVSRYSGVNTANPLATVQAANANGVSGECGAPIVEGLNPAMEMTSQSENSMIYSTTGFGAGSFNPVPGFTERGEVIADGGTEYVGVQAQDKTNASPEVFTVGGSLTNGESSGGDSTEGGDTIPSEWSMIAVELNMLEVTHSLSGTVFLDEGTTNIGPDVTVNLRVNGGGSYSDTTDANGDWLMSGLDIKSGDIVTVFVNEQSEEVIDGEEEQAPEPPKQATLVYKAQGNTVNNLDLYVGETIFRSGQSSGSLTSGDIETADTGEEGILYSVSSGAVTVPQGVKTQIWQNSQLELDSSNFNGGVRVGDAAKLFLNQDSSLSGDLNFSDNSGVVGYTEGEPKLTVAGDSNFGSFFEATEDEDAAAESTASAQISAYNFIVSGGATTNLIGNIMVANDLLVDLESQLIGTGSATVKGGNVTGDGSIRMTGGKFTLEGDGEFGSSTQWSFHDFTFGDGFTDATTTNNSSGLTISGQLLVSRHHTVDAGNTLWSLTGGGEPLVVGGTLIPSTSKFLFTSDANTTLPVMTYNDLLLNPTAGEPIYTLSLIEAPVATQEADLLQEEKENILTVNNLQMGGAGMVTLDANTNDPILVVNQNMLIGAQDKYQASDISELQVGGNFTNSGEFLHNFGTLRLLASGADTAFKYLSNTIFGNVIVDPGEKRVIFPDNYRTIISGNLTVDGGSCESATQLRSIQTGIQYELEVLGEASINHAYIRDSKAINKITASNSINRGNTTSWVVDQGECPDPSPDNDQILGGGSWWDGGERQPFTF